MTSNRSGNPQNLSSSELKNHLQWRIGQKNTHQSYLSPRNNQEMFLGERLGYTILLSDGQEQKHPVNSVNRRTSQPLIHRLMMVKICSRYLELAHPVPVHKSPSHSWPLCCQATRTVLEICRVLGAMPLPISRGIRYPARHCKQPGRGQLISPHTHTHTHTHGKPQADRNPYVASIRCRAVSHLVQALTLSTYDVLGWPLIVLD